MNKATLGDVQASLEKYVKRSAKQPVLILCEGEPVAMLVGINSRKRPTAKLRDVLKRAWKDYEEQGGIGHEQFWEEVMTNSGKS